VTFILIWRESSLQELAKAWLASKDRNAVVHAANDIDHVLEVFPNSSGVAVFDTVREYARPPLAVEYEVDEANRIVHVISVWLVAEGRPPLRGN